MGDLAGLRAMPLFLSCRAAVRAKTSATSSTLQKSPDAADDLRRLARQYAAMAIDLLRPTRACLIAIGGFSGSGKSTQGALVAPDVGPAPGAITLRSDLIRKELLGWSRSPGCPQPATRIR
jgi:hypothetical protein